MTISQNLQTRWLSGLVLLGLCLTSGCQAWNGYPFQNASRVSPPGTGTFQPQGGYYNNGSQVAPAGGVMPSNPGFSNYNANPVQPASFTSPSRFPQQNSAVQPNFAQPQSSGMQATNAAGPHNIEFGSSDGFTSGSSGASGSLSDNSSPQLEWQP